MAVPKSFVDSALEKAKGMTFCGVPIEDLSHDELMTCAVMGWDTVESERKSSKRQRDFLFDLMRAKP